MSKEYGLIVPGKNKMVVQAPGKRAAIFDEDSDSDESNSSKPVFQKPLIKKQAKLAQEKAVEEDPTVYQYDEIYDDMEKQKNEFKLSKKGVDRKPKYIENLMKAAERRKRENEMRIDRQVQKEREAEGDEFKDKESFVTTSYQKKLEEMKLLEEKEKREEYLEAIGDVKKQGNLDGFYRHLYDQKVNYEDKKETLDTVKNDIDITKVESPEHEDPKDDKIIKKNTSKRHYRKREECNSEDENIEVKKEHLPSNLDADSDFSIDSSDSEEGEDKEQTKSNKTKDENKEIPKENEEVPPTKEENVDQSNGSVEMKEEKVIEEPVIKKPKIDIYKKRTVGIIFEEARQRYFERCAMRVSGQ